MKTKIVQFFTCLAAVCVMAALVMISTSCCIRSPFKTPPSEAFQHLGSKDAHWLLVRISPVAGETGLRYFVICRFHDNDKWVVKKDNTYTLYKRSWGHYNSKSLSTNTLVIAQEVKGEPSRLCKVNKETARFLDVDVLKEMLPNVDRVVADDGRVGFFVTVPNTKPYLYWESITFRSGGADLIKEADTLTALLQKRDTMGYP